MADTKNVFQQLKSLDPEQTQIVETKKIDGTHTAQYWLNLLRKIAILDKDGDKVRLNSSLSIKMIVSGIVAFFSIFVAIGTQIPYILIITALAVGLAIKFGIDNKKVKKLDLSNHLRSFLMPFLSIIKEDIPKKSKVQIKASFEESDQQEYIVDQKQGNNKGYPKIKETYFKIPRLEFKATLIDGTQIHLEYTDFVRKRNVTKRNPRGKIKHKVKYKIKHLVQIKLFFHNGIYNVGGSLDLPKNIAYTTKGQTHCFKTKLVEIVPDEMDCMPTKKVLAAIAGIYKRVQPVGKTNADMQ
ncbi:hypothetical protein [Chondrinema litorale]|uniref:hypothetical protein n=1 Tax=Chondrinema litorale TaxID=2994555 RepID=UPI0025437A88|nr:hypothetical protein [Chondrinema litorale]UZR92419.1 hypothetical protein OQ292_11160 [Chondrinema litorale]